MTEPPATVGRRSRALAVGVAVAAAVVVLDQLTKAWALERLSGGRTIDVVWTLRFRLGFNRGMAFSRGQGLGPVIGVVALVVVVVLLVSLRRGRVAGRLSTIAVGLVIGGAVGNIADRMFRGDDGFLQGAVVDLIDLQWWPIFNVADMGITIGGALLVITSFFAGRPRDPTGVAPASSPS